MSHRVGEAPPFGAHEHAERAWHHRRERHRDVARQKASYHWTGIPLRHWQCPSSACAATDYSMACTSEWLRFSFAVACSRRRCDGRCLTPISSKWHETTFPVKDSLASHVEERQNLLPTASGTPYLPRFMPKEELCRTGTFSPRFTDQTFDRLGIVWSVPPALNSGGQTYGCR